MPNPTFITEGWVLFCPEKFGLIGRIALFGSSDFAEFR